MTQPNPNPLVFIGTYTQTTSDGIYVCRFDGESGGLEPVSVVSGAENPSFLALHPNGRFLYAASEAQEFEGERQGALYAYAIDPLSPNIQHRGAGRLEFINSIGSGGQGPCHVRVDATGRFLLAANYHGGSVCVAPIGDDGGLEPLSCFIQHEGASGVNPARQDQAHAHSINPDAQNRWVYVPDLGQDRVVIYEFDAENGTLALHNPSSGRPTSKLNPARGRATSRSTPTAATHTRSTNWEARSLRSTTTAIPARWPPRRPSVRCRRDSRAPTRQRTYTSTRPAGSCTARTGAMTASQSSP